jgi:hypothetical protein
MLDRTENKPIVKSTTEARAGETGHNVRWVLYIGTALAIIVLLGLWLVWAPHGAG